MKQGFNPPQPTSICPYLGLCDDRETRFSFPTWENCCHRAEAPWPVPLQKQEKHCLSGSYSDCAIYRGERLPAPPPAATGRLSGRVPAWGRWWLVLLFCIIGLGVLLLLTLRRQQGVEENVAAPLPSAESTVATVQETRPARVTATAPSTSVAAVDPSLSAPAASTLAVTTTPSRAPAVTVTASPAATPPATSTRPATATPVETPAETQFDLSTIYHQVQPEQTVQMLARFYGTTVPSILALNDLQDEGDIRPGDELRIPVPPERQVALATIESTAVRRHTVTYGDYLSRLARDYDTTVADIQALNPWGDGLGLYPGRILFIPVPADS